MTTDPITGPTLPDGLTMNPDGSITGTPTATTDAAPVEPSPESGTGEPSPELPPTTVDDFDPNDPRTQEQTATAEVPDNPSSATAATPQSDGATVTQAHGWDAGTTMLDTGWFTAPNLAEMWNAALADGHGTQDDFIKIPSHLRDVEDALLRLATAVIANIGDATADTYRVEVEIGEFDGDVTVESRVRRRRGEPAGGLTTGATVDATTMKAGVTGVNA